MDWQAAYVVATSVVCSLSAAWFVWWAGKVERLLEDQHTSMQTRWRDVVDLAREVDGLRKRLRCVEKSLCERPSNCETTGKDGPASTS